MCGVQRSFTFMRYGFLVVSGKKRLKSTYTCGSYHKIKTGSAFLDHAVCVSLMPVAPWVGRNTVHGRKLQFFRQTLRIFDREDYGA